MVRLPQFTYFSGDNYMCVCVCVRGLKMIEDSAYYRLINNSIEYKPGTKTTKTEHNNS